jgi:hypothetical protein
MIPLAQLGAALGALAASSAPGEDPEPAWTPGEVVTSPVSPSVGEYESATLGDGVYGRFSGDLDLGLHGGAQIEGAVGGAVGATAHYFFMAGVFGRYVNALGTDQLRLNHLTSFGVDLRPAFVPRFGLDLQTGVAVLDLALDSISLELGAYFADPGSGYADERGFEGSLGFGLPLMGRAAGLWLDARGLLRWRDPAESSGTADGALLLAVSWHWLIPVR